MPEKLKSIAISELPEPTRLRFRLLQLHYLAQFPFLCDAAKLHKVFNEMRDKAKTCQ